MGRKSFYLVFSKNPAAADIVREDLVSLGENEASCTFQWEKQKGIFEDVPGTILRTGKKAFFLFSSYRLGFICCHVSYFTAHVCARSTFNSMKYFC